MYNTEVNIIGCGWLGKATGKRLNERGYRVSGSTTSTANFIQLEKLGIRPYKLALGNQSEKISHVFPKAQIALILLTPRVIVPNLEELTSLLVQNGVKRVILSSASSVYPETNGVVKENEAVHRISPHSGIDLLALENDFLNHREFSTIILRFAGLYGPGRHPGKFLQGKKDLPGGLNPVNLVHQADCVRVIETILDSEIQTGVFNICADKHPTRQEFYSRAAESIGLAPPDFQNGSTTPHKIVSNELFRETFDFSYDHSNPLKDFNP